MASEEGDYSDLLKLLVFGLFALVGIVSSVLKKRKEQQEIAERQQELRRLDDALGEDRVRKGSSRKWAPPIPMAVPVEVSEPVVAESFVREEPVVVEDAPPARVAAPARAAAAGVDYRKAIVWREIFLPPLALRREEPEEARA